MYLLLVSCATLCASHLYPKGFDHPDKRYCFCADIVEKDAPQPMEITLQWKREIPPEERKAEISEPIGPPFPRYNLLTPSEESDE